MEEYEKLFKKHYRRLALEGTLKSLLFGLISGGALCLILCAVFYFASVDILWLPPVCGVAALITVGTALYFAKFRPDKKAVAARVDMCGLKERLITMVEWEGDTSYMAIRQREDALAKLKEAKEVRLTIKVGFALILAACIACVLSLSATTVYALSASGDIPTFEEVVTPPAEESEYVQMAYMEGEGGRVEGQLIQIVLKGSDCSEVLAVPDDGYIFDIWSDGVATPSRTDTAVTQSATVYAMFKEVEGANSDDLMSDEVGDIEIDDDDASGMMPGGGAAGKYEEYNQIIDGETYYRDVYEQYYEQAMEIIADGGTVPEYLRQIVEQYFDVIV